MKLLALAWSTIFDKAFPGYTAPLAGMPATKIDLRNATIEGIISTLLPYVLIIASLILFGLLIAGGFSLLTAAGNPESAKKAWGKITAAIIGFIIVFLAWWIVQILQKIFGVTLLG